MEWWMLVLVAVTIALAGVSLVGTEEFTEIWTGEDDPEPRMF